MFELSRAADCRGHQRERGEDVEANGGSRGSAATEKGNSLSETMQMRDNFGIAGHKHVVVGDREPATRTAIE